jgi:hypothetical protein
VGRTGLSALGLLSRAFDDLVAESPRSDFLDSVEQRAQVSTWLKIKAWNYTDDHDFSGTMRRRASSMLALPRMRDALLITSPSFAGLHSVTWLGQVITTTGLAPR